MENQLSQRPLEDIGALAVMMMKIWRQIPSRVTFHLFVFAHVRVRTHAHEVCNPGSVFHMRALCDPSLSSRGCLRAHNNEPASCSLARLLYSSWMVLRLKDETRAEHAPLLPRTPMVANPGSGEVPVLVCQEHPLRLFPRAVDQSVRMFLTLESYRFQPESS